MSFFITFCDDWKEKIIIQGELSYKKTFDIYSKFVNEIWKKGNEDSIELLQNKSSELCSSCLNTYNPIIQMRGIYFLDKIYSILKDETEGIQKFESKNFYLFGEVGEDLIELLNGIDNRYIERSNFNIGVFFIQYTCFLYKYEKN